MSSPLIEASHQQERQSSNLTPQFCLNTTALRDFLRLSRATVDDSISAHLNSLIHPASGGFRPATLPGPRSRQNVPDEACAQFKYQILFPSWRVRDNVLTYCSHVAEVPDSNSMANENGDSEEGTISGREEERPQMNTNYWGQPTVVDERTDPYSARDYSYAHETRTQALRGVLLNERDVERIVRRRTWGVLAERCQGRSSDGNASASSGGVEPDWESKYKDTSR